MRDKEIALSKLTIFLKDHNVYEAFIQRLSTRGWLGKTIDEHVKNFRYKDLPYRYMIRNAFSWDSGLIDWVSLDSIFVREYESLPCELMEEDNTWANMWEE